LFRQIKIERSIVLSRNLPIPAGFDGLTSREDKALVKQLRGVQASMSLELAHVAGIEAVETRKVEAIEVVGHVGLAAAGSLAGHRRQLIESDPTALGCANHVTETTVRAIGQRIDQLNRRLG
jgi:hypothetical protein